MTGSPKEKKEILRKYFHHFPIKKHFLPNQNQQLSPDSLNQLTNWKASNLDV